MNGLRLFSRIALICAVVFVTMSLLSVSNFNPVRRLTTWYTDPTLIDIEVVSSPNPPDNFDSKRILRFRIERAFVQFLLPGEPTFVHFGFDMDTGIPSSLFSATNKDEYRERYPDVPNISEQERLVRLLNLTVESDQSALSLKKTSARLLKCAGRQTESDLLFYEASDRNGCRAPSYPKGSRHIAKFNDDLLLQIQCKEPEFPGTGCDFHFPFEGFGVRVSFHQSHLSHWRDVVDSATKFLKSKQYRPG
jgi:hypothetical protein